MSVPSSASPAAHTVAAPSRAARAGTRRWRPAFRRLAAPPVAGWRREVALARLDAAVLVLSLPFLLSGGSVLLSGLAILHLLIGFASAHDRRFWLAAHLLLYAAGATALFVFIGFAGPDVTNMALGDRVASFFAGANDWLPVMVLLFAIVRQLVATPFQLARIADLVAKSGERS